MTARSLILGLDASPNRIGWALVEYESARPVACNTQHVTGQDDLRARREAFVEIARDADAHGDVCAVILEDAHISINKRVAIQHAIALGHVEAFAAMRWPGILIDRVHPSSWRKLIGQPTGPGTNTRTLKQNQQAWAEALLGRSVDEDASDALGIATAAHTLVWEGHAS